MNTEDLIYVGKLLQGTELLEADIYREDYPTYEQYRQAGLKKLIKARDCFNQAFDISSTQEDRDLLRPILDEAESIIIDLQLARTT